MEDIPYSKRELDHYFQEVFSRLDKQDEIAAKTLAQALATNGRVNSHDLILSILKWTCGVLWTIVLIAAPIMWNIIKLQISSTSKDAVVSALSQFNIIYKPINQ